VKRLTTWAVLLAAVLIVAVPAATAKQSKQSATVNVQLLAINDFHGNLEPPTGSSGLINTTVAGGAEYLATHLKQDIATNPNSLVIAAGDLIGASPLLSALFHDEPTIESMNLMNLTVSSVGNHEFDEGAAELLRMQKGGCHPTDKCQDNDGFDGAKFSYLSANVLKQPTDAEKKAVTTYNTKQKAKLKAHKATCAKKANKHKATCKKAFRITLKAAPTAAPLLAPTSVKTVGGVKVGFIGETLKETPTIVTPTGVAGLTFLDEATVANSYAAALKKQGVNTVVLLIHQGGQQTPGADPNGCNNLQGDLVPIINKLSADIDVVVSAHTHQFYNCTIGGKLVTSASSFGRMITRINLGIDSSTGKVVSKAADNQINTRDVAKDAAQTTLVTKYKNLSAAQANKVVGSISADITRTTSSAGESTLGDVIADAQLASTSPANKGSAVVAFMNPGGIRADLTANAQTGGEQPGQITYSEAFTVQPFSNVMNVVTMTGDMIKRVLEQQFDNPTVGADKILQIPNGFTYSYDRTKPAGQRVDASSIKINGTVVAAATQYRVAMNNFLQAGGDGFTVFKEGTNLLGGDIDLDAFVAYLTAKAPVGPGPRNRITRTG
jgi:5''-nucleotidase/2'',3''-cyclic phosphodiesterase and related esterases